MYPGNRILCACDGEVIKMIHSPDVHVSVNCHEASAKVKDKHTIDDLVFVGCGTVSRVQVAVARTAARTEHHTYSYSSTVDSTVRSEEGWIVIRILQLLLLFT